MGAIAPDSSSWGSADNLRRLFSRGVCPGRHLAIVKSLSGSGNYTVAALMDSNPAIFRRITRSAFLISAANKAWSFIDNPKNFAPINSILGNSGLRNLRTTCKWSFIWLCLLKLRVMESLSPGLRAEKRRNLGYDTHTPPSEISRIGSGCSCPSTQRVMGYCFIGLTR